MSNPFEYRTPSAEEIETMRTISEKLAELYEYVQEYVPRSAERTLGIRKLQESRMWVNAALVLNRGRELEELSA